MASKLLYYYYYYFMHKFDRGILSLLQATAI